MGRLKEEDIEPDASSFAYYIDCFFELSTCRNNGGSIPFTAIYQYAQIYNEYDFDEFLYIIRLLDDVYLEYQQNRNNVKEGSKDANSN